MKRSCFILSLIIPGLKFLGNDIDVCLQPLIDELKQLWDGIDTYDSYSCETFSLKGALIWTTNDFPTYDNLSGWGTKGKMACPHCNIDICSHYLKRTRKLCYNSHRSFLDLYHKFGCNRKSFDGNTEMRLAPKTLSGSQLLDQMQGLDVTLGKCPISKQKKRKRVDKVMPWKKNSIFFPTSILGTPSCMP